MKVHVLTLFPEIFDMLKDYSIVGRAIDSEAIEIEAVNIRDFSTDKHRRVDDYPYGGGKGMVMKPEPIHSAIESCKKDNSRVIYLSPQGKIMTQSLVKELTEEEHLILLAGHYEGVDNRIIENFVDDEISIGDYVLTGGELPAMVMIDAISRLMPGVLSSEESYEIESHYEGLLEYPQYTRPRVFMGKRVPDVLLSGDHSKISLWRQLSALRTTFMKRPDMLKEMKNPKEQLNLMDSMLKLIGKR
ncbi:MAG: tRNA (guanosine(37)-N1)-methyltransferase TrmD [Gudongella sp.]|nr:tRNA (guanosine(37)-N1)-methyltransferase TrmD [Gudongella sp.]